MNCKKLLSGLIVGAGLIFSSTAQVWTGTLTPSTPTWRDGDVGIGLGGAPGYKLELDQGDFNILNGNGIRFDGTYGLRLTSPSSSDFLLGDGGRIGIGLAPSYMLDVLADGHFGTDLWVGGAATIGGVLEVGGMNLTFSGADGLTYTGSDFILGNGGGMFGIGVTPSFKLDVDGDINFPFSNALHIGGTKMLSTDASRQKIFLGQDAGAASPSGTGAVFIGFKAGQLSTTGNHNTFIGHTAGAANTGGELNTFVGSGAGGSAACDGGTFVGFGAGAATTGNYNTAFGRTALGNLGSGILNSAFGYRTGQGGGVTGSGSYNVFMGGWAAYYNTSGSNNVYIGYNAAHHNTTSSLNTYVGNRTMGLGSGNVLVGSNAHVDTPGVYDYNTIVGTDASANATNYSGAIGYAALVTADRTIALGATGDDAVTVVIGQTAPVGNGGLSNLGGTPSGFDALEVNGDILSQGAVWVGSDKRFKKNIQNVNNASTLLGQLHPVVYEYRDDVYFKQPEGSKSDAVRMNFTHGQQIGFLAQELEEIMPYAVKTRTDGYKAVNYNHFFGLLVQGHQEQDKAMEAEKAKVAELENKLEELMQAMEELKEQIAGTQPETETSSVKTSNAYLEQNTPNPFNQNTVVKYFIPENISGARIVIRSDRAVEVLSFDITHKGYGNVIISGNTLTTGTYTCELHIGDKMVDYKRMVLVK